MTSDNSARVQPPIHLLVLVSLFLFVVLAWGLNWVVMKIVVREITPIWAWPSGLG